MTHRSAWGRAAYGRSIRAVRQSGPSERSLVRLNSCKQMNILELQTSIAMG